MANWIVPNVTKQNISPFPLPVTHKHTPKQFYTLFKYDAFNKKHMPVGRPYANEHLAWKVYSHQIVNAPLTYTIRPCKIEPNEAEGITHFSKPHYNHAKEHIVSSSQAMIVDTKKRMPLSTEMI